MAGMSVALSQEKDSSLTRPWAVAQYDGEAIASIEHKGLLKSSPLFNDVIIELITCPVVWVLGESIMAMTILIIRSKYSR